MSEHGRGLLTATIRDLFLGIAPERGEKLEEYWKHYGPQFDIADDDGPSGKIVMEAGCYALVRFNHRTMRLFWLSGFLLWEAFQTLHRFAVTGEMDTARFQELLYCFQETQEADNVDAVRWPEGIPPPGELVDHKFGDPGRVGGEIAIFAVGWALLHEIRHLIHQQDGTSAQADNHESRIDEELSCDEFATRFLLEGAEEYSIGADEPLPVVSAKRQAGIYCAMFAITLLAKPNWASSESHPAIQERIDATLNQLEFFGLAKTAALIAAAAYSILKLVYENAPDPIRRIVDVAERERWTTLDEFL